MCLYGIPCSLLKLVIALAFNILPFTIVHLCEPSNNTFYVDTSGDHVSSEDHLPWMEGATDSVENFPSHIFYQIWLLSIRHCHCD